MTLFFQFAHMFFYCRNYNRTKIPLEPLVRRFEPETHRAFLYGDDRTLFPTLPFAGPWLPTIQNVPTLEDLEDVFM
jgi:hypothetical protein